MAFGGVPLWADGTLTLRVRGLGFGAGRPLTIRRPFALLGRGEGSDIRIDDPTVSTRHAYLHIDRRGIFVVDLATRSGLRLDDVAGSAGWLRPGQALEVAGRRIEIVSAQVDGNSSFADAAPRSLLADAGDLPLVRLSLRDESAPETPWTVDSELLFVGRSSSCGVRVEGDGAARIHAVIVRGLHAAYLVDLSGRGAILNGQPVAGASPLADGDHLQIGTTHFTVHVAPPTQVDDEAPPAHRLGPESSSSLLPALRIAEPTLPAKISVDVPILESLPAELVPPLPPDFPGGESQAAVLGWMMGVLQATQGEMMRRQDDFQREVVEALREMPGQPGRHGPASQEGRPHPARALDPARRDPPALRRRTRTRRSPANPRASRTCPAGIAPDPAAADRFRRGDLLAPEPRQPARRREPLLLARTSSPASPTGPLEDVVNHAPRRSASHRRKAWTELGSGRL